MHKTLSFNVSNNVCSVAINDSQNVLALEEELKPSMQAEMLLPLIERALGNAGLTYRDIDYLAVTTGPGSFTGIRIGLAVAEGILHAAEHIVAIGINNFEVAHYRLRQQIGDFDHALVLIDAYRGQQYVQEFAADGVALPPQLVNNTDIIAMIKALKGRVSCCGSGVIKLYESLKTVKNLQILPRFPVVKAHHIGRLADQMIQAQQKGQAFRAIEPLYIRPPDATPFRI